MKTCSKCGASNCDDSAFCESCGNAFAATQGSLNNTSYNTGNNRSNGRAFSK